MDFETLIVWQRSKCLAVRIYRKFARCGGFGFKDQITRSALSVPSNIAEGMERCGAKEKVHFLWVAKASCGELRTQILIDRILPTLLILWLAIGLKKPASFQECYAA